MNASKYNDEYAKLMVEWETCSRNWLKENGLKDGATFCKDGIIDPDVWFAEGNEVRPLFVLKEVYEKNPKNDYLSVNFVGKDESDEDCDIWRGETTWRKVGTLAQGVLEVLKTKQSYPDYRLFSKSKKDMNRFHEILNQIAVINLKKYTGGQSVQSQESNNTGSYEKHAEEFKAFLNKQISLMNPTIIICCGQPIAFHVNEIMGDKGIPVIDGFHPKAPKKIEEYYDNIIEEIKNNF